MCVRKGHLMVEYRVWSPIIGLNIAPLFISLNVCGQASPILSFFLSMMMVSTSLWQDQDSNIGL